MRYPLVSYIIYASVISCISCIVYASVISYSLCVCQTKQLSSFRNGAPLSVLDIYNATDNIVILKSNTVVARYGAACVGVADNFVIITGGITAYAAIACLDSLSVQLTL